MRVHAVILFFTAFLLCFAAPVLPADKTDIPALIYHPSPLERIDLAEYEQFSMMEREMQYMISQKGDSAVPNHFCVIGYRLANEDVEAIVIWQDKNWLIRWGGGNPEAAKERFDQALSLSLSRAIDMNNSLVDSMDDMHGGTGIAIRSEAEAAVADCNQYGKHYAIEPFMPPEDED